MRLLNITFPSHQQAFASPREAAQGRTECQGRKAAPLDGQTHPFFSDRAAHRASIEAQSYYSKFTI